MRGPITSLNEKVSPNSSTYPFKRLAANETLYILFSEEPNSVVYPEYARKPPYALCAEAGSAPSKSANTSDRQIKRFFMKPLPFPLFLLDARDASAFPSSAKFA